MKEFHGQSLVGENNSTIVLCNALSPIVDSQALDSLFRFSMFFPFPYKEAIGLKISDPSVTT